MITEQEYAGKRERVVTTIRSMNVSDPLALEKSTSNLFRQRVQERVQRLDLRDFNHVIRVDEREQFAEVEGLTTYEELVRETLPFQLMPTVVPQLKSITIGGAIAGIGIESSSFKCGFVHETVQELEILLPDGRIVVATKSNEYSDLFFGFPNSYGTLGYVLKLKVKLIPIKPFVKLTHHRYSDWEQYFHAIARLCNERSVDFVDGTMFTDKDLYITTGEFIDRAEWLSDYTYLHIYYQSIRQKTTDYLTAHDYLWRWDTDWFWCSKHFFLQYPVMRWLWGKRRLRSSMYWKLLKWFRRSPVAQWVARAIEDLQEAVIQDVEIPIEHAPEFAQFLHKEIGIKPVWVCPVTAYDPSVSYSLYSMKPHKLYVNFGFWDVVKTDHEEGYFNKAIEAKVRKLDGQKSLYSTSFYSREEFGELYNARGYQQLKTRYDSTGKLISLYEKCILKK
ncbi:MAG TPA: FAD-binding oxidoreductase [Nitrospiraceae bacterium]|nr:FAD-binding oxidoreductase [Nitrospiraceae bacterium]